MSDAEQEVEEGRLIANISYKRFVRGARVVPHSSGLQPLTYGINYARAGVPGENGGAGEQQIVTGFDVSLLDSLDAQEEANGAARAAAIGEIQRLQMQAACVADAFLARSLFNRVEQLNDAARQCEEELDLIDSIESSMKKKERAKDSEDRKAKRIVLNDSLRHIRVRIQHCQDEHNQVSELAARSHRKGGVDTNDQWLPEVPCMTEIRIRFRCAHY